MRHKYMYQRPSLRDFIRDNRPAIDGVIASLRQDAPDTRYNDDERRLWVLNDEGLYNWAQSEGVRV